MSGGDELLDVFLRRKFDEVKKLPEPDRRKIILFAFLFSEISDRIRIVKSPAPSLLEILSVAARSTEKGEALVTEDIVRRVLAYSRGEAEPSLREMREIVEFRKLYGQLENVLENLLAELSE